MAGVMSRLWELRRPKSPVKLVYIPLLLRFASILFDDASISYQASKSMYADLVHQRPTIARCSYTVSHRNEANERSAVKRVMEVVDTCMEARSL
jgi:hypothetical protein